MEQPQPIQPDITAPFPPAVTPPPPPPPRLWEPVGWKPHLLVVAALFVLTGATFSNSYKSGMALDNRYIIEEYYKTLLFRDPTHEIKSWKQISYFFMYDYWWPKGISGLYRPITSLSYWLDYAVFTGKAPKRDYDGSRMKYSNGTEIPDDAWGKMSWQEYSFAPGQLQATSYHTINLLLHTINAILIYFVSLSMLKKVWPAFFVAALFAVHPVTTESVTNIIGRADIFAAMSTFGGLLLYMRSTKSRGLARAPWLIALALVLLVGFLAKESAVAIGAIIPLYWITFEFDWGWLKRGVATWGKPLLKELAVWCVMLPPLFGMLGLRAWVFANATPPEEPFLDNPIRGIWLYRSLGLPSFEQQMVEKPLLGMSYLECKMTAVKIMGKLMGLLAWPATLCCDYSFDEIPNFSFTFSNGWHDWEAVIALGVLLSLLALAVWLLIKGQKAAFFYIIFFFLAALPTSNFIVTIGSVMAERFMYLPLMGFTGIAVIGVYSLGSWIWKKFSLEGNADVPRYTLLAGEVLALVMVAYGVRAYVRNTVWKDDVTLWEDAIQTSTRSFRCYQSLAFAYYERFMQEDYKKRNMTALEYLQKVIDIDEKAIPIISKLPNHLNSSRLYLHLGMYYTIKGDLLSIKQPNGDKIITPEAAPQFARAAELLEVGSQIDRAFNEVNHAKQLRRNDPEDKISEVGLAPIYGTMGMAYEALGRPDEALKRYEYQKQLDPMDIEPYTRISSLRRSQGQLELAAIALIQGMLLDSKQAQLWDNLNQIYTELGAANAIVMEQNQPRLNIQGSPMAREHLIAAYRELIRTGRRTKRYAMAEDAWTTAVLKHGFDRSHFDGLFREPIDIVTPHGIIPGRASPQAQSSALGTRPPL